MVCCVGSKGGMGGSGGKDAEMQQPAGTTCRAGRFTYATALVKRLSGKCLHVQEVEEGGQQKEKER